MESTDTMDQPDTNVDTAPPQTEVKISVSDEVDVVTANGDSRGDAAKRQQSVVDKVQYMRQHTTGKADFAKEMAVFVCCGTVCTLVTIGLMLALPIAMLVIGTRYKDQCPREPYIPTYLIVAGSFGIVVAFINILKQICECCCGDQEDNAGVSCLQILSGPLGCFLVIWFIVGAVWTYRVNGDYQYEHPALPDYCHRTLYLFTFWLITSQFILLPLIIVVVCVGGCVVMCCYLGQDED